MQNGHFAEAEKGGAVVSTRGRACSPDSSDAQHDPSGLLRSRRATETFWLAVPALGGGQGRPRSPRRARRNHMARAGVGHP